MTYYSIINVSIDTESYDYLQKEINFNYYSNIIYSTVDGPVW